jgi:hypothetical protein
MSPLRQHPWRCAQAALFDMPCCALPPRRHHPCWQAAVEAVPPCTYNQETTACITTACGMPCQLAVLGMGVARATKPALASAAQVECRQAPHRLGVGYPWLSPHETVQFFTT